MNDKTGSKYRFTLTTDISSGELFPEGVLVTSPHDKDRRELRDESILLQREALDFDGGLSTAREIIQNTLDTMETINCNSFSEWASALRGARVLAHDTFLCDDPRARTLGFVDHTTNEVFNLSIVKLKEAAPEDWETFDLSKEDFKSCEARSRAIGEDPILDPMPWPREPISDEEKQYLKGLVDEICADIDREFYQEVPDLDEFIPYPDRGPRYCQ